MRICLVSPYDLSEPGGVNKHVEFLAAALRDGGDEVEVIGPSTLPASREFRTGFPGVFSLEGNGSDNRIGLLTPPRSIRRFFLSRELDVLHVHEPLIPMLPWYAVHWARASARVATFHAYTANEPRVTRLARKALSPLLRRFDGGIAVSPAAARSPDDHPQRSRYQLPRADRSARARLAAAGSLRFRGALHRPAKRLRHALRGIPAHPRRGVRGASRGRAR